jgi:hypothetical protein
MNLTSYNTNTYDNNSGLLTMQKRSQNEPNQTQPVVSEVEPFMVSLSNLFYPP